MPKTILLIDDERDLVELLSIWLAKYDYTVIAAEDGRSGIEKARELKPDIILLDILLPKMSGYEVARLLKFDARYKSIPIIMLTARTQAIDKDMAKAVGADDFVTKPFDKEELLAKIKNLLGTVIANPEPGEG